MLKLPPIDEVNPLFFLVGKLKSNKLYFIINIIEINFPRKRGGYKYESIYMRGNKCKLQYIEDTSTSSVLCFFYSMSCFYAVSGLYRYIVIYAMSCFFTQYFFPFGNSLVLIDNAPIFPGIYRFRRREV